MEWPNIAAIPNTGAYSKENYHRIVFLPMPYLRIVPTVLHTCILSVRVMVECAGIRIVATVCIASS